MKGGTVFEKEDRLYLLYRNCSFTGDLFNSVFQTFTLVKLYRQKLKNSRNTD